jgi:hypothetical protein
MVGHGINYLRENSLRNGISNSPPLQNSEDGCFVSGIGWIDDILITYRCNNPTSLSNRRSEAPLCFLRSLLLLKYDLIQLGIYDELKQAYVNSSLEFALSQISSLDPTSRETVLKKLGEEGWDQLDITDQPSNYFYQWKNYQKYQKIRYGIDWQPVNKKEQTNINSVHKLKVYQKFRYQILSKITWGNAKRHYLRKLGK